MEWSEIDKSECVIICLLISLVSHYFNLMSGSKRRRKDSTLFSLPLGPILFFSFRKHFLSLYPVIERGKRRGRMQYVTDSKRPVSFVGLVWESEGKEERLDEQRRGEGCEWDYDGWKRPKGNSSFHTSEGKNQKTQKGTLNIQVRTYITPEIIDCSTQQLQEYQVREILIIWSRKKIKDWIKAGRT